MLYNILDLFSNKESHYDELVREFTFTLYVLYIVSLFIIDGLFISAVAQSVEFVDMLL
jgi:hypothetical protein